MAQYRSSRNIEASVVDYITSALSTANWSGITVEKSYSRVYDSQENIGGSSEKAVICVHVGDSKVDRYEIGTNAILPQRTVIIDIFACNDGQRLDLKDFLIGQLILGMPYYNMVTTTANRTTTVAKTQSGRINVLNIDDSSVNLNIDKSDLDTHDRFRHRLTLVIQRSAAE